MKKQSKDKHFIKKPVFLGGLKAMRLLIKQNLQYPEQAIEHKIEGTVFLKYTINFKGKVIETKVLKSLGYGCDEEAIRIVKLFTFEIAKTRKIKIQFHKNIQIHFKLPSKTKEQPSKQVIQYHYNTDSKPSPEEKNSYSYTIKISESKFK